MSHRSGTEVKMPVKTPCWGDTKGQGHPRLGICVPRGGQHSALKVMNHESDHSLDSQLTASSEPVTSYTEL